MSQIQYVGARYVPIWYQNSLDDSADWEVNVEYEALTWVTSQNNHLYLSKKTVPDNIGSPALNPEYWLDMGVYSGGSTQHLQDEIDALDTRVGTLEGYDIPGISSDVTALDNRVDNLEDFQIILIGDSYGNQTALGHYSYVEELPIISGISATKIIANCVAGAGFAQTAKFEDQIQDVVDNLTADQLKKPTYIFFVGGINDINLYPDFTTVYAGMDNCAAIARNNFTNIKTLAYCCCGMLCGSQGSKKAYLADFHAYMRENSPRHGIAFMNYSQYILTNYTHMESDGLHPTLDGSVDIAVYLSNYLYSGVCEVNIITGQKVTLRSAFGSGERNLVQLRKMGDITKCIMIGTDSQRTYNCSITLNGNDPKINFADFTDMGICGRAPSSEYGAIRHVPCVINGTTTVDCDFMFLWDNSVVIQFNGNYSSLSVTSFRITHTIVEAFTDDL